MNYELFKQIIAERIKDFLPPGFVNYTANISVVRKVNQEKDTLIMMPENHNDIAAMPNIYLDEMYEEFKQCGDLDAVLHSIALLIIHYTGRFTREELNLDFRDKKDAIVMNLINTERNRELLKTVPHREVLDLSVVYRIIMGQEAQSMATVLVDNRIMEELELTQDELEQIAYENTGRMFPVEIFKLTDVLYIMTNQPKVHGATTMVFEEAVRVLADRIGGDFYLIPSSIHEVLAVPEEQGSPEKLIKMLEEGNRVCGMGNEILSNSVYFYRRETGGFTIAASYYS